MNISFSFCCWTYCRSSYLGWLLWEKDHNISHPWLDIGESIREEVKSSSSTTALLLLQRRSTGCCSASRHCDRFPTESQLCTHTRVSWAHAGVCYHSNQMAPPKSPFSLVRGAGWHLCIFHQPRGVGPFWKMQHCRQKAAFHVATCTRLSDSWSYHRVCYPAFSAFTP